MMMNMREAVLFLALLKRQFTQSGAVCVIRLRYEWISPSLSPFCVFSCLASLPLSSLPPNNTIYYEGFVGEERERHSLFSSSPPFYERLDLGHTSIDPIPPLSLLSIDLWMKKVSSVER